MGVKYEAIYGDEIRKFHFRLGTNEGHLCLNVSKRFTNVPVMYFGNKFPSWEAAYVFFTKCFEACTRSNTFVFIGKSNEKLDCGEVSCVSKMSHGVIVDFTNLEGVVLFSFLIDDTSDRQLFTIHSDTTHGAKFNGREEAKKFFDDCLQLLLQYKEEN